MLSSSTVSSMRSAARQVIRRGKATVENATSSSSSSSGTATTTKTASTTPILSSLAAALGGVTLVSVGAAVVENMTADQCLPYSSTGQRFDQSDFQGRFARMLLACDPRLLLYSAKDIEQAQALLKKADSYQEDRSMDRTLWEARRVVDAALHPDTGATIPLPFRMSGYVPFNGPICVAMVASTTTPQLLFWSWVNQSQNALVNYYVSWVTIRCLGDLSCEYYCDSHTLFFEITVHIIIFRIATPRVP